MSVHLSSQAQDWQTQLRQSLRSANVPTLLMVLIHLTGDRKWLSQQYQCTRIAGLDDNDTGGLPDARQAEIRNAAWRAILDWKSGAPAALPAPAPADLVQMLATSIGEPVPESYGSMIASWLGLDKEFALDQQQSFRPREGFKVLVIGAGVAGICAAIRLQGAGIDYTVIEKNSEAGGTWYENRYPGAGVDTPNHIYSFSFAKQDWTKYFALRDEIQAYFVKVVDDFKLRSNIQFNTACESAVYNEDDASWSVTVKRHDGRMETLKADVVISAVGILNVPKFPAIKGLESFAGDCFHTARWPEGLDVSGKRVGVIGNGASAMQIVPAIVDNVAQLTVFQRSKQWAAPFERFKKDVPSDVRFLLREVPFYQEWYRQRLAWVFNDRIHASLQIDPTWPHPERSINRRNEKHREFFTHYIQAELGQRQDLLPDVLPDYPPFGKRMLMDNGWYRTMTKPNVTLVNTGIDEIHENRVKTRDGQAYELDVLIVATGFNAVNFLSSVDVKGRGGESLRERWDREGAEAYLGVAVPGLPNFFVLAGPNTALGHGGSVVATLEIQVRYVMGLLRQAMDLAGQERFEIEVKGDVCDEFNQRVQRAHDKMIWTHKGMSNWYRTSTGKVVAPTPFRNDDYWHMLRKTDLGDYVVNIKACESVQPSPQEVE
ncbi:NAD(P)/FAD-dependent oxidoreductase [Bordetella sp. 15P40C-2]|uniref:flavin-containing monooxygenase n=1 Tax=Bordetella sp. 15P40C-2 TaxID=2572246 RepID=UPI001324E17C|nr:NAD(P)/FAD-dependent oxidoreductase [Bordetella sp. 15P40C-2]MVW72812.1 FAD-dependent oxidoreductase [Bordetella sp. 15P40C-2]